MEVKSAVSIYIENDKIYFGKRSISRHKIKCICFVAIMAIVLGSLSLTKILGGGIHAGIPLVGFGLIALSFVIAALWSLERAKIKKQTSFPPGVNLHE